MQGAMQARWNDKPVLSFVGLCGYVGETELEIIQKH